LIYKIIVKITLALLTNVSNYIKQYRTILILVTISFVIQLIFIFLSDKNYLITEWFTDDSYYYLQAAYNFKHYKFFTFDGINITYGFQPLWMILCTIISILSSSKSSFFYEIIIFASIIYTVTGILLFKFSSMLWKNQIKYIPSLIWLFNGDLIQIFTSGKENVLAVMLIVIILIIWGEKNNTIIIRDIIWLGILSGLLILTRVNTIIFLPIILWLILTSIRKNKFLNVFLFLSLFLIIIIPWIIYSYTNFRTIFPTSGNVKLHGVSSSWLLNIKEIIPIDEVIPIEKLLTQFELKLFKSGISHSPPEPLNYMLYVFRYLPITILGFGIYGILKTNYFVWKKILEFVFYLQTIIVLITIGIISVKKKISFSKICFSLKNIPLALKIITVFAVLNSMVNFIFLSKYIQYANWYAFPEILALIFLTTYFLSKMDPKIRLINFINNSSSMLRIISVLFGIIFLVRMCPKTFYERENWNSQMWKGKEWIEMNVSKGTKIGAWSSGALGYWLKDYQIINLDGLINSPDFANETLKDQILFGYKLSNKNLMWEYIKRNNIKFIANSYFIDERYLDYFHWTIPKENYTVLFTGTKSIDWNEPQGKRKYYIIKLKY